MSKLTQEQTNEIENLMESWGAWVYSGRLEKREVSMLGQLMARVNPKKYENRPMCDDDTGMIISEIMKEIKGESEPAYYLLIQYYVYMMARYQIAVRFHRKTSGDKPSLGTYRNIVDKTLNNYRYYIYHRFNELKKESLKIKKTG